MSLIIKKSKWLCAPWNTPEPPVFRKCFTVDKQIKAAKLTSTAMGIYEAEINGKRVGEDIFAPGWTMYQSRLQYQQYDVTDLISDGENTLDITVANGWCIGEIGYEHLRNLWAEKPEVLAVLEFEFEDGTKSVYPTDESWQAGKGIVQNSEFFYGEDADARMEKCGFVSPVLTGRGYDNLIEQEGPPVRVTQIMPVKQVIVTPKGETVLDFGQNMTGTLEFEVDANAGDEIEISHAEILDEDGNFYTDNYRGIRAKICYICKDGTQKYRPKFTFQGFRYIRLDKWPGKIETLKDAECIKALVLHSQMERTGFFECSDESINKLFENVVWGQRGNFLEVPTDCPQRNERIGWMGDAQVFIRAASYNFDVEQFFGKWFGDIRACQHEDGGVPIVVPFAVNDSNPAAAWSDAAIICPWQIYLSYGNKALLERQFDSMRRWIDYVRAQGDNEFLWDCGLQYGDWLALDGPCPWTEQAIDRTLSGKTQPYQVSSAYYAYITGLFVKAGHALGKDVSEYEMLYQNIRKAYIERFIPNGEMECSTQTAWALSICFDLVEDKKAAAAKLAQAVEQAGMSLTTGFVGTPWLLHALSDNGYEEMAYTLLLRHEYPSWLYAVDHGATTIWETWDGIAPDGSLRDPDMNSHNHYSYGAVADWLYSTAAGISPDESAPGYKCIRFAPKCDSRLDYCRASLKTRCGTVEGGWRREGDKTIYHLTVPDGCTARICIGGEEEVVNGGTHERIR